MDPTANLREQLQIVRQIREGRTEENPDLAERLAELVSALDGWLVSGGFLPLRWSKGRSQVRDDVESSVDDVD